jgi:hypothetical protein
METQPVTETVIDNQPVTITNNQHITITNNQSITDNQSFTDNQPITNNVIDIDTSSSSKPDPFT